MVSCAKYALVRLKCSLAVTSVNHTVRLNSLDILATRFGLVINHIGATATAGRPICQLPYEDGRCRNVAADNRFDMILIGALGNTVGRPILLRATVAIDICIHTTVMVPIIDKVNDQFDVVGFSRLGHIIETLKAISSRVDGLSSLFWSNWNQILPGPS
jgi:hypothetical protein